MSQDELILSCEHAGNHVPEKYRQLFQQAEADLNVHTGWDPGALTLTKAISRELKVGYYHHDLTRLLVEVNRSVGHEQLFSAYTRGLTEATKLSLMKAYYYPHRDRIEQRIREVIASGKRAVHIGVHTFTPVFHGKVREVEAGLLFDEAQVGERIFCENWKMQLQLIDPRLKVRYNEPYLGADDGFTTYLRTKFPVESYLGIELEVSQKYLKQGLDRIGSVLSHSLEAALK